MKPFLRFFFIIFLLLSSIVKIFAQNNSELNYSYEEIEKKIALINLNIDEQNSLKHNELIKIRRIFYSYRHLLLCLEFLNPDL